MLLDGGMMSWGSWESVSLLKTASASDFLGRLSNGKVRDGRCVWVGWRRIRVGAKREG